MAAKGRSADFAVTGMMVRQPELRGLLSRSPWEFEFFQAVRILQRIMPFRKQVGKGFGPHTEVARFTAHASMAFPASQIQGLDWHEDRPVQLAVNFMGLHGPMGVLPIYYTEFILQRLRAKDASLAAFLDIFNHRMISLFYQAWEKYRFYVAHERGERDRLSQYLLDLLGLGTSKLHNRQQVRDESLIFYAGLVARHGRSALALEQMLSDYFDVPVAVEQYVGAWYGLERNSQCRFGDADSPSEQMGVGVIVGDEVWDPQSGVRIRVGPLTLKEYLDFLPNGSAYRPMQALTKFFSNGELNFEMQLVLKRDETPGCELGTLGEAGPRLGWVTWAKARPMDRDPDETTVRL
jgi:type VI secretion system protein ImpH